MSKQLEIDYSCMQNIHELLGFLRKEKLSQDEYWFYIDRYREQKARDKGIPLHGMFELTPLCNLNCKMCYVHLDKNQMRDKKLLNVDQWISIIQQAHELGMIKATLTGGECLTYKGFDEIYLFLRNIGIKPSIKTNGLLIDSKRFDFFKRYPPGDITVSLYGSSNDTYKSVTGYAVFDKVYENLIRLKNADYPVIITITPNIYMYDDILKIVELSEKLGFQFLINIALFQPRAETGRTICDLSIDQYLKLYQRLREKKIERTIISEGYELSGREVNKKRLKGISCGAGRSIFNINWKGQIKGCENLNSLQISAIDQPFKTAWEKVHYDAETFPLPEECNSCSYDNVCFGCLAYRTSGAEAGHCNPKVCERTRRMVEKEFYRL